ncbi:PREDICTED: LOW QUALITY PROTEIN: deoxyribonuclease-1-like 2 [Tauraco erythrolophus]|uniref:LOW QUALITY PROTEIN: deoxyribonuclease-1-like 2 n=1 Tax=Tauraco erythrolophus TaxID=121530 RepID=UPI000523ADD6|nr:PREDICTED: LOW QUALITY PROTEIN: deoxyribonuclease-1-like 2 [Tauraco erythrolophus]
MASLKLVLSLLIAALLLHVATTLKISAFNIKTFGDSKMSNQTVADIIVSILSEYDITVVQEVRDTDLSAVKKLVDLLNSVSLHPYSFLDSIPLGWSSYKEQYIFIYRSDMVSVLGSYYYDDGCESCGTDTFIREPFIVKFSSPTTQVEEFVMVPLHAQPSSAVDEMDALYDVYTDVVDKWATNNIFFLGDFNAGCSYVTSLSIPSGRMGTTVLALFLLAVAFPCLATATLRVGAFNIQAFGDTKMSNEEVAGVIVSSLRRYDVVLVQEVRDSDLSAVTQLMEQLNSMSMSPYDYEISGPLGRDNYKEMYLFIYRPDVVSVMDTYQYEDPQDVFSREPFILRVSAPRTSMLGGKWSWVVAWVGCRADIPLPTEVEEFVLVPLHSAPQDAVAEIDALYDVYLAIVNKWGTDNIMFLGDFNADCAYVQPSDWSAIRLRTSDVFKWLIPDSTDTTVGKSDCAYDRIVVCGAKLKRSIVPNSAAIYNFQRAFQLEQEEQPELALAVPRAPVSGACLLGCRHNPLRKDTAASSQLTGSSG